MAAGEQQVGRAGDEDDQCGRAGDQDPAAAGALGPRLAAGTAAAAARPARRHLAGPGAGPRRGAVAARAGALAGVAAGGLTEVAVDPAERSGAEGLVGAVAEGLMRARGDALVGPRAEGLHLAGAELLGAGTGAVGRAVRPVRRLRAGPGRAGPGRGRPGAGRLVVHGLPALRGRHVGGRVADGQGRVPGWRVSRVAVTGVGVSGLTEAAVRPIWPVRSGRRRVSGIGVARVGVPAVGVTHFIPGLGAAGSRYPVAGRLLVAPGVSGLVSVVSRAGSPVPGLERAGGIHRRRLAGRGREAPHRALPCGTAGRTVPALAGRDGLAAGRGPPGRITGFEDRRVADSLSSRPRPPCSRPRPPSTRPRPPGARPPCARSACPGPGAGRRGSLFGRAGPTGRALPSARRPPAGVLTRVTHAASVSLWPLS